MENKKIQDKGNGILEFECGGINFAWESSNKEEVRKFNDFYKMLEVKNKSKKEISFNEVLNLACYNGLGDEISEEFSRKANNRKWWLAANIAAAFGLCALLKSDIIEVSQKLETFAYLVCIPSMVIDSLRYHKTSLAEKYIVKYLGRGEK